MRALEWDRVKAACKNRIRQMKYGLKAARRAPQFSKR